MEITHSKMNARLRHKNAGADSMTKNTNHLSATDRAAIQLQREEHEFKLDFRDILKALFMWKEKPTERVRNK